MRTPAILALTTIVASTSTSACSSSTEEKVATAASKQTSANFCPKDLVPRRDMARYLTRLKRGRDFLPQAPRGLFKDIPDATDQGWAEALYDDGITQGCGDGAFCPNDTTPREQMAAFIVRLFHGRDFDRQGPSRFVDVVDGHAQFAGYIEQLADDGITRGCDATHFCPSDMVPREQMAAFLMRAAHPGSAEGAGSGRYLDVARDSIFAGRIEQAVDEGIMEPCGVESNKRVVAAVPSFGQTARFGVYAKSSIDHVNQWEEAPYDSNFGRGAAFTSLLVATNRTYSETPSPDWWGAQWNSKQFRLWSYLAIDTQCWGAGQLDRPTLPYVYSDGGEEGLQFHGYGLRGSHHIETAIHQEGAGWGVRYVLHGSPDAKVEGVFQNIKGRSNTAIFQYGTVHLHCDAAGTPQASFDTFEGPSYGGSSFPTHHAWIFRDGSEAVHEYWRIGQAYSDDPAGPGLKNLWFLPPVPPP